MSLVVGGVRSTYQFQVGGDDTPSSIALDLLDFLAVAPTAETLTDLVHQIEAALEADRAGAPARESACS